MGGSYGAKQRHMERARYTPTDDAGREVRDFGGWAGVKTFKRKGDVVLDEHGRQVEVTSDGWH